MNPKVFGQIKPIIGILQLLPLPGSPGWKGRLEDVIARAEQEATAMAAGGIDAILVENTHDIPYTTGRMDPAGAIAMALIVRRLMQFTPLPVGIHVLQNDPETALAIAMNVGASFIRVGLLTGSAMTPAGTIEGKWRDLVQYQKTLQAEGVAVFADVSLQKTLPLLNSTIQDRLTLQTLIHQTLETDFADAIILTDTDLPVEVLKDICQHTSKPVFYIYSQPMSHIQPYLDTAHGLLVSDVIKKSATLFPDQPPTVDISKTEELTALAQSSRTATVI